MGGDALESGPEDMEDQSKGRIVNHELYTVCISCSGLERAV